LTHPKQATTTRFRILGAAERLFAENGFAATSMRQITAAAKVNLAAVNYHFSSKESLYKEVVLRRIRPLNAERLSRLEQALDLSGDRPPLELVIDILVQPAFEIHRDPSRGGVHFVRIMARSLAEPLPFMHAVLAEEFHGTLARFGQVIRRHATHLSPEEFMWRLSFVVGAMQHTLATLHQMSALTRGLCRDDDYEGALLRFVHFAAATFMTPAVPRNAGKSRIS
jgi:AcrR family transcriptional regulator